MMWGRIIILFLILVILYSLYEASTLRIKYITVSDDQIPKGFDGKKIVFISDIHYGLYFSLDRLRDLVEKVNELEPDIILIGGDYTTEREANIEPCIEILQKLSASLGIYSVLGNHDSWGDPFKTTKALENIDIKILTNKAVWIDSGNSRIRVGGVGDLWTDTQDINPTLANTTDEDYVILLTHNPMYIEKIQTNKIDLILSGHTHGGQILPVRLIAPYLPSKLKQRYLSGIYEVKDTKMIVTNGIGTVFIPARLFAPPEIVVINLEAKR